MPNKNHNGSLHSGHRQRLKNCALTTGLDGMSDFQVMELLLFYAMPYRDTNELAHALLEHFGSFSAVLEADYQNLLEVKGIGPNTATLLTLMPDFFRRYQQDKAGNDVFLLDLPQYVNYTKSFFIGKKYEEFYMICLNRQRRLIRPVLLNTGSLSNVHIYPRVVVDKALLHNAKYVILAHNHPGGKLEPSAYDIQTTKEIIAVLDKLSIKVLDHLIISGDKYFSFIEKGLIPRRS